ncbi:phenylacetate--CoA ligase family protein [Winogradskyella aurantia]|uniref:AMP-binding protein n=1 Tax=Winogradskyella aurantia TaxID=1915063 RepID=A0A265UZT0_9FLAO|nr:phenylacetate--CoA ligase family protein [Winogradskyella aurantia]OZV70809.1 AMP-binding protein [Winogradskyella aurantia]
MRLFDFSLKLNGFAIAKARQVFTEIQNVPEHQYTDYIEQQRKAILTYHLEHNPFYKSYGKSIDVNDWNTVPVIGKKELQQPLENRLSRGFTRKNVYINKTSGSSGHPFVFAKDKWSHALTWAEIMNRFSWYGIDFNTSKQARFYGIPLDKKGYYKERFKDFFSNRYRFSIFDLSDTSFESSLKKFESIPFEYINGYTSSIVRFAKFLNKKNLLLKTICPSLRLCVATAEMLFDDDKILLQNQFGIPVINEYGASELGLIAFQNPNDEWQVNSETLFVEILDHNNHRLKNGQEGKIVVTSLYNKAHPFIRYDLGDLGILSLKSSSKKPILEKLTGRTNDIAILPSGKEAAGLTFYYITKSVIEDDGNVGEFIIEQHTKEHFKVKYISKEVLSETKQKAITAEMKRYLEPGITIEFERLESLKRTEAGKLKQFVSLINQ